MLRRHYCPGDKRQRVSLRLPQHRRTWLLFMVLGFALAMRVWGIHFGLPYDFTYDEVHEIVRAFKLGAGEYDWDGFGKGGLYQILFVEYGLLYVVWWLQGHVANAQEFALRYFQDASTFYLAGRLTVALMGTLTCLVIYGVGRHLYQVRVALGAALLGATAFYHSVWSHYINVDIGMTLALWASILAYLHYEATARYRWLVGAGLLGGMAIAYKLPGVVAPLVLLVACVTSSQRGRTWGKRLGEASLLVLLVLAALTLMAPEWVKSVMHPHFAELFRHASAPADILPEGQLGDKVEVNAVTILRGKTTLGYLAILCAPPNLALTLSALLGLVIGLWHRQRWATIWLVFLAVSLGALSLAERAQTERYVLPMMPCLWLLSSYALVTLAQQRLWPMVIGFACVIVVPLAALVYQNYMWTQPDTRVLAKAWIEAHVPTDATILMDGMRYRFVQSPPLRPNARAVARRVSQAQEAERLSRGISDRTLALYAKAMAQVTGPKYDLHSTVWGLEVADLTTYVDACFDYIITSSANAERYVAPSLRERFPHTVWFYEQLPKDPRFRMVYRTASAPWQRQGPTITVYQVLAACGAPPQK